jgi:hypothetical protein
MGGKIRGNSVVEGVLDPEADLKPVVREFEAVLDSLVS